ncbi:hypothetical protein [Streptomyces sp. LaBMicrA B280]|uniref:hypothetical protein n=1 Tax=Streptomyces sp. LaBMicrA B280 TaxID=3391001 RepID=UPI003BA5666C
MRRWRRPAPGTTLFRSGPQRALDADRVGPVRGEQRPECTGRPASGGPELGPCRLAAAEERGDLVQQAGRRGGGVGQMEVPALVGGNGIRVDGDRHATAVREDPGGLGRGQDVRARGHRDGTTGGGEDMGGGPVREMGEGGRDDLLRPGVPGHEPAEAPAHVLRQRVVPAQFAPLLEIDRLGDGPEHHMGRDTGHRDAVP